MTPIFRFSIALAAIAGGATVSRAQIAADNVPAAARVFSFLNPSPSGPAIAAIIFDPANSASAAEAAQIERGMGDGLVIGSTRLMPRRVPIGLLANLHGARVAFVTQGLRAHYADIGAASHGLLTITSDRDCVVAGKCVVGISNGARTEIVVSRAALTAAGIRFGSMFAMLAKEI